MIPSAAASTPSTAIPPSAELPVPAGQVPRLHPDLRILPFDEDGAGADEKFLVEVREAHYVVSRVVRDLLLAIAEEPEDLAALRAAFERISGLEVDAETLAALLGGKLPAGFFAGSEAPRVSNPFLFNFSLIREERLRAVADRLTWLLNWPLALLAAAGFVVVEALAFQRSVDAMESFASWGQVALLVVLVVFAGLWHEIGHITACRKFGGRHGGIGFGLYLIFPAFYADVTGAWRLAPKQRAVVDAAGLYFQMLLLCVVGALAWLTADPLWFQVIWVVTFLMAFTLNPVFKLDGYWLLVDLSGLRNLHRRVVDLLAYPFRRLLGRPAPLAPLSTRRWVVLASYVVLSLSFYMLAVVLTFIILHGATMRLPMAWDTAMPAFSEAWQSGRVWAALGALGPLLQQVLWPLLVLVLLARWVWKLLRAPLVRRQQRAAAATAA